MTDYQVADYQETDCQNSAMEGQILENEVPSHLRGLQVLAEGYQFYISYLKEGGADGISAMFGELVIEGA